MKKTTAIWALRAMLWVMALDAVLRSALQLIAGRSLMASFFPYPPASEVTDLLLLKQKEWGVLGVALTLILISAARNPLTSVSIIRAMAIGLALAGAAELIGIWAFESSRLYPVTVTIAHAGLRFTVAGFLIYCLMRSREAGAETKPDPQVAEQAELTSVRRRNGRTLAAHRRC